MVKLEYEDYALERKYVRDVWVPKSIAKVDKKGLNVPSWFLRNKQKELFRNPGMVGLNRFIPNT